MLMFAAIVQLKDKGGRCKCLLLSRTKEEARNKKAGARWQALFDLSYVEDKAFSLFKYIFIRYCHWSLTPNR